MEVDRDGGALAARILRGHAGGVLCETGRSATPELRELPGGGERVDGTMSDSERAARSGVQLHRTIDVVVVEDDHVARDAIEVALREGRCEVRAFSIADDAIAGIVERAPDVVVCGLREARGISGPDLASAIRADLHTMHIGLVAVSGPLDARWQVLRPFDAFLRRPFDSGLLTDVVRAVGMSTRARARSRTVARRVG